MNTNQDTPTPRTDAIHNTYLTNIFTIDYLTDKLTIESRLLECELTAAREECARWRQSFDGHVYLKSEEYAELCEIKRQRDRLAEALESIVGESAYEGLPESKQQAIEQALQSLNQNSQADRPQGSV